MSELVNSDTRPRPTTVPKPLTRFRVPADELEMHEGTAMMRLPHAILSKRNGEPPPGAQPPPPLPIESIESLSSGWSWALTGHGA